jgi:DNA repair exonuclease SbcCD ATPase subunit
METTGIRLEVTSHLYTKLQVEQLRQKNATGTKPALAAIILKLCELGIRYQDEMKTTTVGQQPPKPKDVMPAHNTNSALATKERELIAKEKELLAREHRLKSLETDLRSREYDLIEKSKTINESAEDLMEQRNDIYDQKEVLQEKSQENLKLSIQKENLEKILADKNEQLLYSHNELQEIKQKMFKIILNIDRKTETNTFMKFIMPLLPVVATVISTLILRDAIRSGDNLSSEEKEIIKSFKELNPDDQEQIRNYLNDLLKKPGTSQ